MDDFSHFQGWSARYWSYIRAAELQNPKNAALIAKTLLVLPLGACEQHGPHLPLATDAMIADGIIQAALENMPHSEPILIFPTQTIGFSAEHLNYAGTISHAPQTQLTVLEEIGAGLSKAGFRRILFFNAHGGNAASIDIAARQYRAKFKMMAWHCNWFNLPFSADIQQLFSAHEWRFGVHAGEIETSLMLHFAPQTVNMAAAGHFQSRAQERVARFPISGNGKTAKLGWAIEDYNGCGAAGCAAAADAVRGAKLAAEAGRTLAQLMRELIDMPLTVFEPEV